MCSADELTDLQNPALAAAVGRERCRLARLHECLFRQPLPNGAGGRPQADPVVGLESFIWAHCLVRSRALDLTAAEVGACSDAPAK